MWGGYPPPASRQEGGSPSARNGPARLLPIPGPSEGPGKHVRVNNALSEPRTISTGAPQGCVSSPVFFTLYTNDCTRIHPENYIIKFSDDTAILGLMHKGSSSSAYHSEIERFVQWCDFNHLVLNVKKTEEMVWDPKAVGDLRPVVIHNEPITQRDGGNRCHIFTWDPARNILRAKIPLVTSETITTQDRGTEHPFVFHRIALIVGTAEKSHGQKNGFPHCPASDAVLDVSGHLRSDSSCDNSSDNSSSSDNNSSSSDSSSSDNSSSDKSCSDKSSDNSCSYNKTSSGYNKTSRGYNKTNSGYNKTSRGYNKRGYNKTSRGYNKRGYNKTNSGYNNRGYNKTNSGYNKRGYNKTSRGYNKRGYNKTNSGYNKRGYNKTSRGYSKTSRGYNKTNSGYSKTSRGYNKTNSGYSKTSRGYSKTSRGYSKTSRGYNKTNSGYSKTSRGYNKTSRGYNKRGYNKTSSGYNKTSSGYNKTSSN
ncbi:probable serine/threonine-protein kinase clkA [Trematomus bernacchii]|uniref:probable serine/threonine-protein kinase clkA n=1 Tax=Trematomus bernacchii TaxID=40690 RepID=UPI00146CFDAA|nr:probable serine/threonine-protein kinase clkA [Trematomus bernacchii]